MKALPDNWATAPLGQFSGDCSQRVPGPRETFSYIDIASIDRDSKTIKSPQLLSGNDAPSRARKHVHMGDVLVSMTRPNLNAVAMISQGLDGEIASTGFDVLRASHIDPRWLFYIVRTTEFVEKMMDTVQGALYPAVRSKDIRSFEAPLAPRAEQKRIADKLDALLARVDASRERLDRIPVLLQRFRRSVLAAAITGKLTEDWRQTEGVQAASSIVTYDGDDIEIPGHWQVASLRTLANPARPLCYGVVQPGIDKEGGVPLVRVQDMEDGRILTKDLRTISDTVDAEYRRSRIKANDLLISVVGTIGRIAIVPPGLEANIARAIARVSCRETVNSRWIKAWLSSDTLQWWMNRSSREVARKTLNLSELGDVTVALPPIDEQNEIVRRVEALFALVDRIEARYKIARAKVDQLTPALLAKAFCGELVPQDPNDEPASVLLERIRAERAAAGTSKPRRGRKARESA